MLNNEFFNAFNRPNFANPISNLLLIRLLQQTTTSWASPGRAQPGLAAT